MIRHALRGLTSCALAWLATTAPVHAAEPRDSARVFFFGNSLIHHLTDTDETTVPHWLALMARQDGRDFAANGRWGFPREFATQLLQAENVAAVPGNAFGDCGEGFIRCCFAASFDKIEQAMERTVSFVAAIKKG